MRNSKKCLFERIRKITGISVQLPLITIFLLQSIFLSACNSSGHHVEERGNDSLIKVSGIELGAKVKLVPSDGSVIVSSLGERGVQFIGSNLGNVHEGDYLVTATPITENARAQIGHLGGYMKLSTGFYLVPREQMDDSYLTPGNADFSHFLIHAGKVIRKIVNTGPLAHDASEAFASNAENPYDKTVRTKIFGSIFSSVANAFTSAASAVANVATNIASGVKSAATSIASGVTSAASAIADNAVPALQVATVIAAGLATAATTKAVNNSVDVSRVEQAVTLTSGLVGLSGGKAAELIGGEVTTFEVEGVDFNDIIAHIGLEVDSIAKNLQVYALDDPRYTEKFVSGIISASTSADGRLAIEMNNFHVQSHDGTRSAVLNGILNISADEYGYFKVNNHIPDYIHMDFDLNTEAELAVSNAKGTGVLPVRGFQYTPTVVDAGIPIIVVREIDIAVVLDGTELAFNRSTSSVHSKFYIDDETDNHALGTTNIKGALHEGESPLTVKLTNRISLYDTSGTYMEVDLRNGTEPVVHTGTDFGRMGHEEWSVRIPSIIYESTVN